MPNPPPPRPAEPAGAPLPDALSGDCPLDAGGCLALGQYGAPGLLCDRTGRILYVSPALVALVGGDAGGAPRGTCDALRAPPWTPLHEALLATATDRRHHTVVVELPSGSADAGARYLEFETFVFAGGAGARAADVTRRVEAERALLASEARYRAVVESQSELIARFRPDGTLTFVNEAVARAFAPGEAPHVGGRWWTAVPPAQQAAIHARLARLSPENPVVTSENEVTTAHGVRTIEWTNRGVFDAAGRLLEIQAVGRDTTERCRLEAELRAALDERDTMLRELHHRVKNNLQIAASLLSLQARGVSDPATRELFAASERRLYAMALVHELLHRAPARSRCNATDLVDRLAHRLFDVHEVPNDTVRLVVATAPVELNVDATLRLGLIAAELLANAARHAFPAPLRGTVTVRLARADDGAVSLTVADDGVGLPADVSPATATTLGLQLVANLSRQLGGELRVERAQGTRFTVCFVPSPE